MKIINELIRKLRSLRYYVIADPSDNSITLSKRLFLHLKDNAGEGKEASVFVFRIHNTGLFGFTVDHGIKQPTQLCQIQYNGKYRCVGFETLCPSVGRIFYEYGLPALRPVKLSVSIRKTPQGKAYYLFDVPTSKLLLLCKASSATRENRT